jgi:hypothetical protein
MVDCLNTEKFINVFAVDIIGRFAIIYTKFYLYIKYGRVHLI